MIGGVCALYCSWSTEVLVHRRKQSLAINVCFVTLFSSENFTVAVGTVFLTALAIPLTISSVSPTQIRSNMSTVNRPANAAASHTVAEAVERHADYSRVYLPLLYANQQQGGAAGVPGPSAQSNSNSSSQPSTPAATTTSAVLTPTARPLKPSAPETAADGTPSQQHPTSPIDMMGADGRQLRLRRTGCNDVALVPLCDALKCNSTVRELDLSDNAITDAGIVQLADALLRNRCVTSVDLRDNVHITSVGLSTLVEALRENDVVTQILLAPPGDMPPSGVADAASSGAKLKEWVSFSAAFRQLSTLLALNKRPLPIKNLVLGMQRGGGGTGPDPAVVRLAFNPTEARRRAKPTESGATAADEAIGLPADGETPVVDDVSVELICDVLKANTVVTRLDLSYQPAITDRAARHLAEVLRHNRHLDDVRLNGTAVTTVGVQHIIDAVFRDDENTAATNSTVTTIQLFDTGVSPATMMQLEYALSFNRQPLTLKKRFPMLQRNDPTFTHLELDDAASQRFYDDVTVRLLSDVLPLNSQLLSLALPHAHLTPIGCQFLADVLQHRPLSVQSQVFSSGCGGNPPLVHPGVPVMPRPSISRLQVLDLTGNEGVGCKGAAYLAAALSVPGSREDERNAAWEAPLAGVPSMPADDGVASVGGDLETTAAISWWTTLRLLRLSHCGVGEEGAQALAAMLRVNRTLQHLDLSHNPRISAAGAALAKAFNATRSLLQLDVEGTSVSQRVLNALADRRLLKQECARVQRVMPMLYDAEAAASREGALKVVNLRGSLILKDGGAHQDAPVKGYASGQPPPTLKPQSAPRKGAGSSPARHTIAPVIAAPPPAGGPLVSNATLRLLAVPLRSNYHVTSLDLSENTITFEGLPPLFTALQDNPVTLKTLSLANNPIGNPHPFGQLLAGLLATHRSLTSLDVRGTGLDTTAGLSIAQELDVGRINPCVDLRLDDNPDINQGTLLTIQMLVECNAAGIVSFKQRLRVVLRDLAGNARRGIDPDLVDFGDYVEEGDASGPKGGEVGAIPSVTSMTVPAVGGTSSPRFDAVIAPLTTFLRLTKPRRLRFCGNGMSDAAASQLAFTLATSATLTWLDVSRNDLTAVGVMYLAEAVRQNYAISDVDIRANPVILTIDQEASSLQPTYIVSRGGGGGSSNGGGGWRSDGGRVTAAEAVDELESMLVYNTLSPELKSMLLSIELNTTPQVDQSFRTSDHLNDNHMRLIARALRKNRSLTLLDVSNNHCTFSGFRDLMLALVGHPALRVLRCKNTLLSGGSNVGELVAALLLPPSPGMPPAPIEEIDLSCNDLENAAVPPMRAAAEANKTVRIISVADSGITTHLSTALSSMVSLNAQHGLKATVMGIKGGSQSANPSLDLSGGRCTDRQVIEVFAALSANEYVTSVDISGNGLTDASSGGMLAALSSDKSIRVLDLSRNSYGAGMVFDLARLLRMNGSIQKIDLRHNKFPSGCLNPLRHAVADNNSIVELLISSPLITDPNETAFLGDFALNRQPILKAALPRVAANDPSLTTLMAADDRDKDDLGLERLCLALHAGPNMNLTAIDVSNGHFTDASFAGLCQFLFSNESVSRLSVGGHPSLGPGSAEKLADVLKVNRTLTRLSVAGNTGFGEGGMVRMAKALEINDGVIECDVSGVFPASSAERGGGQSTAPRHLLAMRRSSTNPAAAAAADAAIRRSRLLRRVDLLVFLNSQSPLLKSYIVTGRGNRETPVVHLDLSRAAHERYRSDLRNREAQRQADDADSALRRLFPLKSPMAAVSGGGAFPSSAHGGGSGGGGVRRASTITGGARTTTAVIDDACCQILCEAMSHDPYLRSVSLSGHGLGPVAANAIASFLRGSSSPSTYHGAVVWDPAEATATDDCAALSAMSDVTEPPCIYRMDLSRNAISDAVYLFVDALVENAHVLELHLGANGCPLHTLEVVELLVRLNHETPDLKDILVALRLRKAEPREIALMGPPRPPSHMVTIADDVVAQPPRESQPVAGGVICRRPTPFDAYREAPVPSVEPSDTAASDASPPPSGSHAPPSASPPSPAFSWDVDAAVAEAKGRRNKRLADDTAAILCDALKSCLSIRTLLLPRHDIGDAGARAIAQLCAQNPGTLTRLDLSDNLIGDVGCCALADVVGNPDVGLREVSLTGNPGLLSLAQKTTSASVVLSSLVDAVARSPLLCITTGLTALNGPSHRRQALQLETINAVNALLSPGALRSLFVELATSPSPENADNEPATSRLMSADLTGDASMGALASRFSWDNCAWLAGLTTSELDEDLSSMQRWAKRQGGATHRSAHSTSDGAALRPPQLLVELVTINLSSLVSTGTWTPALLPRVVLPIASALAAHRIVRLELEFNDLTDSDVAALAQLVPAPRRRGGGGLSALRELSLANNRLENIEPICWALLGATSDADATVTPSADDIPAPVGSGLLSLDIRCNRLSVSSAYALATVLRQRSRCPLRQLDARHNAWGRLGGTVLLGVIAVSRLESVAIVGDGISDEMDAKAASATTHKLV